MKYIDLLKNICDEENIKYKMLSEDYVMCLTKNGITKNIHGFKFPLNDHALGEIFDDKYAFYDLCKYLKLPIIEHSILFNPNSSLGKNTKNDIIKYFNKYKKDVVVKPNNGTTGIDVYHITTEEELVKVANKLFVNNFSISICPYYHIDNEYRLIVLDNEILLSFKKSKPIVVGNGIKTIKELLLELNHDYFKNIDLTKYNKVLNVGESFEYNWQFNLSKGAIAEEITDKKLLSKLEKLAKDVVYKTGIRFASIDIIKCKNKLYVLEANSGVCISKACNFIDKDYSKTKEVYRKAIKKLFE